MNLSDKEFMQWFQEQLRDNKPVSQDDWARFLSMETCPRCKQVKRASAIVECRACLLEQ